MGYSIFCTANIEGLAQIVLRTPSEHDWKEIDNQSEFHWFSGTQTIEKITIHLEKKYQLFLHIDHSLVYTGTNNFFQVFTDDNVDDMIACYSSDNDSGIHATVKTNE